MNHKIQVVSTRLRWSVLAIGLLAVGILLINFFLFDKYLFNSANPFLRELWAQDDQYRPLLLIGQVPTIVLFGLFIYWLWRLFGQYAKGDYFDKESDRCYLWLVCLYGAIIPLRAIESAWISYIYYMHSEEVSLHLPFDIGRILTLFVLVSIFFILRAAKQIDQENKEFV
ncbi:hypothetical protein [Microbulbifer sp. JMSA003]|uniref:hypothetical protein n=1 Tax=Microbulbifer sp. JMSA003 TaxID=3243369 RepID=UPI002B28705B|nr:hypothetical protein QT397_12535 [Microbulbifer sp. MKSA007]